MPKEKYPAYVPRLLRQAKDLIADEHDADPAEAASLCFEILSLFPDHAGALKLIDRAFRNPWLIRENRKALRRLIDEWDDRPWQQRRRHALSFRYMSRWQGWDREYEEGFEAEREGPEDVRAMLDEGHRQLLHDYLVGDPRGSDTAWPIFQDAIRRANDPRITMLWVGKQYAEQGYFAESVDVLQNLLDQFPKEQDARRLLAEVRWWRDNVHRLPWLPPPGDGSRHRRYLARRDPERLAEEEQGYEELRRRMPPPDPANLPPDFVLPPSLAPDLAEQIESALPEAESKPGGESAVDWSYLDDIETGEIDTSKFPKWARDMLLLTDDPERLQYLKEFLAEYLADPAISAAESDDDEEWEDESDEDK